jgi:Ca-activated chloride channel homolog
MSGRALHFAAAAFFLLAAANPAAYSAGGVTAPPPTQTKPQETFGESVSVGYVVVPFVALDARGRAIRDLRAADVSLIVDGARVATDMFERADKAPVSFTILLDGSGSMALGGKQWAAVSAIHALISKRIPGDDFSLHVFADGEVREVVPFTRNTEAIIKGMASIQPYGKTAFFDALSIMPDKTILGENGSRAIILLTDGLDNASQMTAAALTAKLEGVDVPVYPLGLRLSESAPENATPEALSDYELLHQIATVTGGRASFGTLPDELDEAIDQIAADLRAQYIVGFAPTGKGAVKYRRVSLKLPGRARTVRVRQGYRGTEPPAWKRGGRRK